MMTMVLTPSLVKPATADRSESPPPLWLPTRYSFPLCDDFPSHADWLLPLVDLVWRLPDGSALAMDPWQRWLIRHILEVFPEDHEYAGELRYRQVLVSLARQNGKSLIGAILALYGLVREAGALVIGIASNADQAGIIYRRLLSVINGSKELRRRFQRLTDTRGIQSKDGSHYLIKPAKSAAVQGLDVSVGLADELHLVPPELWSDMVNGTRARRNGLVAGITTAGDDTSELLIRLYSDIDKGEHSERFGYFIWEAPEPSVPHDRDKFKEYLVAANPAIACGRIDIDRIMTDLETMPQQDVIRYALNRFTSHTSDFMAVSQWMAGSVKQLPAKTRVVLALDRTPSWSYAAVTASWKLDNGKIATQLVAAVNKPSVESLVDLMSTLNNKSSKIADNVMDGYTLKDVAAELKRRGMNVRKLTLPDVTTASSLFYARVQRRRIIHLGEQLVSSQLPGTMRKNVGEHWRITRKPGATIDAVMSTVLGVYGADTLEDDGIQLF